MANPVASILVQIGADTRGIESGGRRASKSLDDLGRKAAELGAKMAALGAAAAAAGAAMVAGLVKSGLSAIDTQAKLARSLDGSVDSLRTLQLAAQNAGISADAMSANIQRMNRRLGEMATTGAGPAAAWIDRLGLSAQELLALPLDERVSRISDEISQLSTSAEMASAAFAIFGDGGLKMVPMLQEGSEAIRSARKEVEEFGLTLSDVDARQVEAANDAIGRMAHVMESVRNKITVALAPLLGELAERFNGLARANEGFGGHAMRAIEAALAGFAKLADVVHIAQIGFKGLQLAAATVGQVFWQVARVIGEVFTAVNDAITKGVNFAIRGLNKLGANIAEFEPFTNSEFMNGLRSIADTASEITGRVRTELLDLTEQEWPSTKIEEFLQAVRDRSREAAEAVEAARGAVVGGGGELGGEDAEQERRAAELDRNREMLQAKLDQLREFVMTEEELEIARHERRMAQLTEALDAELLTIEEYKQLERDLEAEHMKRIEDIRARGMDKIKDVTDKSFQSQAKSIGGYLGDIASAFSQHSRSMFEANKVAGIANAIVATHQGIAEALKLGWPLGPIKAAAIAAQGFAQVAAIKSTSFNGGGGGTSAAAGGGTEAAAPAAAAPQPVERSVLTVEGVDPSSLFSGRVVRELAERLQEHVRDGGTVQFA